jgi:type VI secretion system protein ImpA
MAAPHGRGWLDLQRYTVTACERLGATYDPVVAAVRDELRVLLRAAPWLPEATLMDETPTANAETRAWLVSQGVAAPNQAGSNGGDQLAPSTHNGHGDTVSTGLSWEYGAPPPQRDALLRARTELEQGRPNRAIGLLVEELAREQSPRGRFIRQTQIASLMVGAGLEGVAQPILERLLEQIEEHKLEAWEAGDLIAEPLVLLCRCIDKLDGDQDDRQKLYLRVCRLDPLQAITLHAAAPG